MTAALQLVARGYGALGLPRLTRRRGPLIVMYHGIGGADGVDVAAFAQQLAALCARRRVVPLQEAVRRLDHPDARELAALTFDDGYRDFAERALPVLAERELHATLFVPAGHLGGHNAWDDGRMQRREILDAAR